MRKVVMLSAVVLVALSIGAGCASHTRTVRTETVEHPAGMVDRSGPVEVEQQTTTTTTETPGEPSGLISGTVHVMGEIFALPFRLMAGMIRLFF